MRRYIPNREDTPGISRGGGGQSKGEHQQHRHYQHRRRNWWVLFCRSGGPGVRISLSAGMQRAAGSLTGSSSLFIAQREGVVDVSGSLREGGVGFAENDDKCMIRWSWVCEMSSGEYWLMRQRMILFFRRKLCMTFLSLRGFRRLGEQILSAMYICYNS